MSSMILTERYTKASSIRCILEPPVLYGYPIESRQRWSCFYWVPVLATLFQRAMEVMITSEKY